MEHEHRVIGYLAALEYTRTLRASSYVSLALCELMDTVNTRRAMDMETDSRMESMIDSLEDMDVVFGHMLVEAQGGEPDGMEEAGRA